MIINLKNMLCPNLSKLKEKKSNNNAFYSYNLISEEEVESKKKNRKYVLSVVVFHTNSSYAIYH